MDSGGNRPVSEHLVLACTEAFGEMSDERTAGLGKYVAEVIAKRGPVIREAIQEGGPERSQEMADVLRLIDLSEQTGQKELLVLKKPCLKRRAFYLARLP